MDLPNQIGQNLSQVPGVGQGKFNLKKAWPYVVGALLVVVAGVGTAWMLSGKIMGGSSSTAAAPGVKATANEAGTLDPNVKYDDVTGKLVEGGVNNEGTHHLERDGGPSQNVYLTSSTVNLSTFVGKNVEIWGETMASKKVGWLMDVAKIKVVNN